MILSLPDINRAAQSLGIDPCAVSAVIAVESAGSGFLPDGRARILFEGHVFWKELQKHGLDPTPLAVAHPDIVYPRWDRSRYRGGAAEWDRLDLAVLLHEEAALCSASYGLFQIMGFNHKFCGFDTVQAFVDAQKQSEARQLEAFCAFMRARGLAPLLAGRDWAGFARRYNGPGYAANQYDLRLLQAYNNCKQKGK